MKLDKLSGIHNFVSFATFFQSSFLKMLLFRGESFSSALSSVGIQQQAYCNVYLKNKYPSCSLIWVGAEEGM